MGPVKYKIKLPPSMKRAHNVFHVSKLKPYYKRDDSGTVDVVIDAGGTMEQDVKEILGKKREHRTVHYLAQFEGNPTSEAIWLPKSELKNGINLVREYEKSTRTSTSKKGTNVTE